MSYFVNIQVDQEEMEYLIGYHLGRMLADISDEEKHLHAIRYEDLMRMVEKVDTTEHVEYLRNWATQYALLSDKQDLTNCLEQVGRAITEIGEIVHNNMDDKKGLGDIEDMFDGTCLH